MLTQQDVVTAYKLILGREPESAARVQSFVDHCSFDDLRQTLLSSGEFGERVSRDPQTLGVPLAILSMTAEVQRYQRRLQTAVSLGLPSGDRSVLLLGDEFASLAWYFEQRRCKVTIAASDRVSELVLKAASADQIRRANLAIEVLDFCSPTNPGVTGRFDLVQGELPDRGVDAMRSWLDNAAASCSGTLIVEATTAPGRFEEVFVTPSRVTSENKSIPTRRWLSARLLERFEHVYSLSRRSAREDLSGGAGIVETGTVLVASRGALASPVLDDAGGS